MDDSTAKTPHDGSWARWSGLVVLLGGLAVAASTEQLSVWRTPDATESRPTAPPAIDEAVAPVAADALESGVSVIGIIVLACLMAVVAFLLLRSGLRPSPLVELVTRRFGWRHLAATSQDPLPDPAVVDLGDEIAGARDALLDGDARNGIVACWMRLERGAVDAGLPRRAAETAQEYSHRVVTTSSVDPTPINELAELYHEARFSVHAFSERDRDRALVALRQISDGLTANETATR